MDMLVARLRGVAEEAAEGIVAQRAAAAPRPERNTAIFRRA